MQNTASASSTEQMIPWHSIDWVRAHRTVRKLQVRIAKATKEQDWRRVKTLQRFLTRSFAGRALAVKRVTENTGKRTPGVDGETWSTPETKAKAVLSLKRRGYKPRPLKRVYIPKSNGKQRPLGIPTIKDRAMQALYLLALEPVSETLADRNSYGFRPERCTADAIEQCFTVLSQDSSAGWILEGDIRGCFDNISHDWLLAHVPMDKAILRKWLKAGYVEHRKLFPTEAGTPQGGIISPALANMVLDGLEAALETAFGRKRTPKAYQNKVHLVRYADDFIITAASKELLENEVKPLVAEFLAIRGLELSQEKTKITHIAEGFDFLGQNVRKYNGKLIIKPSKKNVHAFKDKIREIMNANKATKQATLIRLLNPVIRGWANYHKSIVAKETFNAMDSWIWRKLWQWATRRHPSKRSRWVRKKYFRTVGARSWVFEAETGAMRKNGEPDSVRLFKASSVPIRRHKKIQGDANPFDPAMELYFEELIGLRMQDSLRHRRTLLVLWRNQEGCCPRCHQKIVKDTGWHRHHKIRKIDGGGDNITNLVLLHPNCHRQVHGKQWLTAM
jgi:RNA-directed DNA polymerase